jgi:3-hydroxyisobutyrate dehydrogenase-like beta-hydroxyacid dehydrogenase
MVEDMNKPTVAILGLGIIGEIWARNLIDSGFPVRGWNRSPKPLPYSTPDIHAAIKDATHIIVVVADPSAVASVLEQIKSQLHPGQLVIQSSTISEAWTKRFAALVESTGASFLEAPFTGSKPAAEQRKTVFYVGGPPEIVELARPVLEPLSLKVVPIGDIGSASALKLALNLNIAQVAQALNEAITFTRRAGLSDDTFFEALSVNAGRSGLSDLKEPKLKSSDWSPQFSIKHMGKDLRLALESIPAGTLPQLELLQKTYEAGLEKGWGNEDFCSLIRLLKE